MPAGQGHRELDLAQGRRGRLPRPGPRRASLRRRRRRDGVRRGGPGDGRRAPGRDPVARLPDPDRGDRLPARGHHLRPERPDGRHRHRGARRLRGGLHRGDAPDQGALPARQGERRHLATSRSPSAARTRCARRCTRLPVPRDRAPASTWGSSTPGSSRSTRRSRRTCSSTSRTCCSTGVRTRPSAWWRSPQTVRGAREGPGGRGRLAPGHGRGAHHARARARHRRLRRDGHRGGAPEVRPAARRDRGPADGRDERGRRPVRLRQDVPAAGREERARHEEGRRLPDAVPGGGEAGERRPVRGQDRARHGQGRRPRHRQEHRRRRAAAATTTRSSTSA